MTHAKHTQVRPETLHKEIVESFCGVDLPKFSWSLDTEVGRCPSTHWNYLEMYRSVEIVEGKRWDELSTEESRSFNIEILPPRFRSYYWASKLLIDQPGHLMGLWPTEVGLTSVFDCASFNSPLLSSERLDSLLEGLTTSQLICIVNYVRLHAFSTDLCPNPISDECRFALAEYYVPLLSHLLQQRFPSAPVVYERHDV